MSISQYSPRISSTPRRRQLSHNELRQILSVAEEDPRLRDLHDIASIILCTGIRMHELAELRWADVDFSNCHALVFCSKTMRERFVPLGPKTLRILEARRSSHPASEYVLGDTPRALLNRVVRQLRNVGNKIGISPVSIRVLRHTFFLRLMNTGADSTTLLSIGGYRPSSTSMKSFLSPVQQCKVAARFQMLVEEQL
jgi:integrase